MKTSTSKGCLPLTLKKVWFDLMITGEKTYEYRAVKPYWTRRLHNQVYDKLKFTNGYGKTDPYFVAEFLGVDIVDNIDVQFSNGVHLKEEGKFYRIRVGRILEKGGTRRKELTAEGEMKGT